LEEALDLSFDRLLMMMMMMMMIHPRVKGKGKLHRGAGHEVPEGE